MERLRKHQWLEQVIYGTIWLIIFLIPLIGGYFAINNGMEDTRAILMVVRDSWISILPFLILFAFNNYWLVPYRLFRKKYWQYSIFLFFMIGILCFAIPSPSETRFPKEFSSGKQYKRNDHSFRIDSVRKNMRQRFSRVPHRMPLPLPPATVRYLIHFAIAILMIGFNIAIKLFFKSLRDEETLKELEHQNLQTELQYLKYQINPHFFMNTLNNIHALVNIDANKAQGSIIELSKLMRYVLYEASNKTIFLIKEIQFLENYIALMRLRYIDKVSITVDFPKEIPEVMIPPLLFISFIENAFKHGISYQKNSFVHIRMQLEESNRVSFRCDNSNGGKSDEQHHGIGLENVRKRLKLLFGNDYTLSIQNNEDSFHVLLIIPFL